MTAKHVLQDALEVLGRELFEMDLDKAIEK